MAKIIEITAEHVSIGMDDGSIREIRPSDVSFIPQIGDEVEIYETENRIIVQKKSSAPQTPEGGILPVPDMLSGQYPYRWSCH